jgi:hypothetical protein
MVDQNNNQGVAAPTVPPSQHNVQPVPVPAPQGQYQQAPPQPQVQYAPAPLTDLTGGMKFGWLVIGILMGIPGILIAWLTNAGRADRVRSDAIKFTVIGLVVNIAAWVILAILGFGFVAILAQSVSRF